MHTLTVPVKEALSKLKKPREEANYYSKLRDVIVISSYALKLPLSDQSEKQLDRATTQEVIPETNSDFLDAWFLMCTHCIISIDNFILRFF